MKYYIFLVDLYKLTFEPVKADLQNLCEENGPHTGWQKWVEKWSKLSVNDFLRTKSEDDENIYRPWPEIAIRGYQVKFYNVNFIGS